MQRVTRWPTALLAAPIVCALTAAAAGCTKAVDGTALAAEHAIPATSTASPAPRAIPTTVLEGVLLSQDQLIALVGGANMALVGTATSTSDSSKIVDDRTCLGLGSVGDVAIYANSGYVAMRGNQFSTPNAVAADVTQLVT
jgi:PknH-like protein